MNDSLPVVKPQSQKITGIMRRHLEHSRANTIVSSQDVKTIQTPYGSYLKLNPQLRHQTTAADIMRYRGEYDPSDGYAVNDVVRVLAQYEYAYTTGNVLQPEIGEGVVVPATTGVWICRTPIPDKRQSDKLITLLGVVSLNYRPYLRAADVKYYPQYPEPADLPAYHDVEGRYWELLSGAPTEMITCEDGVGVTRYVDMVTSGSTES